MKKLILMAVFLTNSARADMYMECEKLTSMDKAAPQQIEVNEAGDVLLLINGKAQKKHKTWEETRRSFVMEYVRAEALHVVRFDYGTCDGWGEGSATYGQLPFQDGEAPSNEVIFTDFYQCKCAVD